MSNLKLFVAKHLVTVVVTMFLLNLAMLGWSGTLVLRNQRNIAEAQRQTQFVTRSVVRCALNEYLDAVDRLTMRLGVHIIVERPNIENIDCNDLLNTTVEITGAR